MSILKVCPTLWFFALGTGSVLCRLRGVDLAVGTVILFLYFVWMVWDAQCFLGER